MTLSGPAAAGGLPFRHLGAGSGVLAGAWARSRACGQGRRDPSPRGPGSTSDRTPPFWPDGGRRRCAKQGRRQMGLPAAGGPSNSWVRRRRGSGSSWAAAVRVGAPCNFQSILPRLTLTALLCSVLCHDRRASRRRKQEKNFYVTIFDSFRLKCLSLAARRVR